MKPYYEDSKAGITIYHGDCRDVLPQLSRNGMGIVTDPPYGIAHATNLQIVWMEPITAISALCAGVVCLIHALR